MPGIILFSRFCRGYTRRRLVCYVFLYVFEVCSFWTPSELWRLCALRHPPFTTGSFNPIIPHFPSTAIRSELMHTELARSWKLHPPPTNLLHFDREYRVWCVPNLSNSNDLMAQNSIWFCDTVQHCGCICWMREWLHAVLTVCERRPYVNCINWVTILPPVITGIDLYWMTRKRHAAGPRHESSFRTP